MFHSKVTQPFPQSHMNVPLSQYACMATARTNQNRSIARGSVGPERLAPDSQGRSHDIFCQIYPNLSVLPHHFHIPSLHFFFLISMVKLYTNEWTGNLSLILFTALL